MISLSKITVSDKVSAWIQLVNNIVDTIKLAVAPSSFNEKGEPVGGIDGYLSSLDKKKIDELDITYMPIRGELPADATWYKANAVTDAIAHIARTRAMMRAKILFLLMVSSSVFFCFGYINFVILKKR